MMFILSLPDGCIIPDQNIYRGKITNNDGIIFADGSFVHHGESVNFECPPGHVPNNMNLTCYGDSWNTEDGKLPVCKGGTSLE